VLSTPTHFFKTFAIELIAPAFHNVKSGGPARPALECGPFPRRIHVKRVAAAVLLALAAGLAGAAPGDKQADKARMEQYYQEQAKEREERKKAEAARAAEPGVSSVFEGRSTAFWVFIGAILGIPVVLGARRR
jgi:hypothetical protein